MGTLTDHLRQAGDHGRLPFHPACPVCRDHRLAGPLPPDNLVPPRTRALLAAGVLALSTAGPSVAVATGQTAEEQGVATPPATPAVDTADDPDFDPGGDSTQLPDTPQPAPRAQAPAVAGNDADTAPLDQEPTSDSDAPIIDAGDGIPDDTTAPTAPTSGASAQPTPTPPPAAVPTTATPTPTPTPASTPAPSATPPPATATATPTSRHVRPRHHRRHSPPKRATRGAVAQTAPAAPAAAPSASSTPAPAPAPAPPAAPPSAAAAGRAARPRDHTHLVRPVESLWSVAADLLGNDASPAAIARNVHRLWDLNQTRIGTGNPDLLMPGTRLVLP